MACVSYHIAHLLDKMTSSDKDFRFMATNDLMSELQKGSIKLDEDSERKVVKMLLKLLEDKNGEVQNLAVKCLGPLVNKVKEYQVETIVETLCSNMLSEKEQLRDISSIGLKTVIGELPPSSTSLAASLCQKITGRLTSAITKEDVSVQLEALDILGDLLSRFGSLLVSFHQSILQALLPQLISTRLAVRKRAIIAIGFLVMSCSLALFNELIEYLLTELTKSKNSSKARTYIQCIGAISRQAGHRVGEHLVRIVPQVMNFCMVEDEDELREYCIQSFESFVRKCPKEITSFVPDIVNVCLQYLTYDPNYNYDDDDADENSMQLDGDEDLEGESEDEYSDDDDMSWKVRRAAAKCIDAIIATRHDMLAEFYRTVSPALIARFKEREENVKADIFHAYTSLLKATKPTVTPDSDTRDISQGPVSLLRDQAPDIVRAINKQLKEKSIKTRLGCFSLLTELVVVLPGALSGHIPAVIPGILYSLGDKNSSSNMKIDTLSFLTCCLSHHAPAVFSLPERMLRDKNSSSNMKIDTLSFLTCCLSHHAPAVFHPHIQDLIPPVISAVGDPFYKITSEALLSTQQIVKVIRPLDSENEPAPDFKKYTQQLYTACLMRLRAADIDQEVKERAIACMGQILCNVGDCLTSDLDVCLPIFLERLKNEITRLTTVKAVILIARSSLRIDITPILKEGVPILASFLRKNHRALKLSTLACLDVLVKNYGSSLTSSMVGDVMKEIPTLISENDLHVSQLALTLLSSVARVDSSSLLSIHQEIIPQVLILVRSPLLQGGALQSLMELFQVIVAADLPRLSFMDLMQMLITPIYNPSGEPQNTGLVIHKQAFHSIARCVAALTVTQGSDGVVVVNRFVSDIKAFHSIARCVAALTVTQGTDGVVVVNRFVSDIKNTNSSDSMRLFSLLALGEIGQHIDLSKQGEIPSVVIDSFSSYNEEVKSAASYALGKISVGNLPKFLPIVLREIETQPRRQYLLLHSLKEIISSESQSTRGVESLKSYLQTVWSMLFNHCEYPEEGTRNVVAECLGKLTLIDPVTLLPQLKAHLESMLFNHCEYPEEGTRNVVAECLGKLTLIDPVTLLPQLKAHLESMLFNHCEYPEEGTRNVVAECLGKLTLIDPVTLLPQLKAHLESNSALTRSTVVTAIKFTISDQPQAIDTLLRTSIGDFLKKLQDPDLNVRRVALVTFNSAAHNKPMLIRDLLDSVLPYLYNETKVRKELIKEVEMGPFKHTVDEGLDIRKAAFECMYTLLDSCLDRIDIFEFLNHVEDGLKDHYDIKMLMYLTLVRLAVLCPHTLLQRLDRLIEPLRTTCAIKVKAHSVKQEFEKQDDLKRSALRAVTALHNIPDADKNAQMNEFVVQIKSSPDLSAMYDGVQKDSVSLTSLPDSMDLS